MAWQFADALGEAMGRYVSLDELAGRDFPLPSFADPAQARLNDLYGASDADAQKDMLRAAENAHAASEGRAEEESQQGVSPPSALSA